MGNAKEMAAEGLPRFVVGWIVNHARKNYWRVAHWYEIDDLIQDGLMIAYKCRQRYGTPKLPGDKRIQRVRLGEIDAPHFLALVQTSFHNHIGDLIRKKRALDDNTTLVGDAMALDKFAPRAESLHDLMALVASLPTHLRELCEIACDVAMTRSEDDMPVRERNRMLRDLQRELRTLFWLEANSC